MCVCLGDEASIRGRQLNAFYESGACSRLLGRVSALVLKGAAGIGLAETVNKWINKTHVHSTGDNSKPFSGEILDFVYTGAGALSLFCLPVEGNWGNVLLLLTRMESDLKGEFKGQHWWNTCSCKWEESSHWNCFPTGPEPDNDSSLRQSSQNGVAKI